MQFDSTDTALDNNDSERGHDTHSSAIVNSDPSTDFLVNFITYGRHRLQCHAGISGGSLGTPDPGEPFVRTVAPTRHWFDQHRGEDIPTYGAVTAAAPGAE